jgi:4-amino-4-deoxy-L-arabinose transferase-like glycosyltransferase
VREPPVPRPSRGSQLWRSPPGPPALARPSLIAIAGLAAVAYAWGSNNADLEPFYGAAARSMSESWHDFLFGAFDPAGTITVDKLPGALWVQALSLRVLGFHVWALVLPQIVEGVLTILVLYRAVRRLAGPAAGVAAAAALAASPVTVALSRGNVSDSLLILLTVLAADAASAALLKGRLRSLLLAGLWVGLAFQAKMLQAWAILPALALPYVVAAPGPLHRRVGHLALAGALALAVSLSWMSAVSLVPRSERPYVDGTLNDSLFTQVFDYNGLNRTGHGQIPAGAGTPAPFLVREVEAGRTVNAPTARIAPSWHRLLGGPLGRDDGWLLALALISAIAVLMRRRGAGRRDPLRAAVILWGAWLLTLAALFSVGSYVNSYYVAALSPATAALCGVGVALFWQERRRPAARVCLAAGLIASGGYGAYLLRGGEAVPGWLLPSAVCLAVAGALIALLAPQLRGERRAARALAAAALACALPLSAVTSALVVTRDLGPFNAPYGPATGSTSFSARQSADSEQQLVDRLLAVYRTPIAFAADTSLLAAPAIYYTGREVLPIGGYAGGLPVPSLAQLRRDIASGQVRAFLIPIEPRSRDPRIVWVQDHCAQLTGGDEPRGVAIGLYDCRQP